MVWHELVSIVFYLHTTKNGVGAIRQLHTFKCQYIFYSVRWYVTHGTNVVREKHERRTEHRQESKAFWRVAESTDAKSAAQ